MTKQDKACATGSSPDADLARMLASGPMKCSAVLAKLPYSRRTIFRVAAGLDVRFTPAGWMLPESPRTQAIRELSQIYRIARDSRYLKAIRRIRAGESSPAAAAKFLSTVDNRWTPEGVIREAALAGVAYDTLIGAAVRFGKRAPTPVRTVVASWAPRRLPKKLKSGDVLEKALATLLAKGPRSCSDVMASLDYPKRSVFRAAKRLSVISRKGAPWKLPSRKR